MNEYVPAAMILSGALVAAYALKKKPQVESNSVAPIPPTPVPIVRPPPPRPSTFEVPPPTPDIKVEVAPSDSLAKDYIANAEDIRGMHLNDLQSVFNGKQSKTASKVRVPIDQIPNNELFPSRKDANMRMLDLRPRVKQTKKRPQKPVSETELDKRMCQAYF